MFYVLFALPNKVEGVCEIVRDRKKKRKQIKATKTLKVEYCKTETLHSFMKLIYLQYTMQVFVKLPFKTLNCFSQCIVSIDLKPGTRQGRGTNNQSRDEERISTCKQ